MRENWVPASCPSRKASTSNFKPHAQDARPAKLIHVICLGHRAFTEAPAARKASDFSGAWASGPVFSTSPSSKLRCMGTVTASRRRPEYMESCRKLAPAQTVAASKFQHVSNLRLCLVKRFRFRVQGLLNKLINVRFRTWPCQGLCRVLQCLACSVWANRNKLECIVHVA